jgi:hypothetical protein
MTALPFTTCPARHAGDCDAVLTPANVLATLEAHGFTGRLNPDTSMLEAWEPATVIPLDGGPVRDASAWVPVPSHVHHLAIWLGY